jgi:RNA polymerase-interacting CarD/CdnL/TRCF family regulator
MANYSPIYSIGDRVVHRAYGVGKIDSVEWKTLNGTEVEYFKVKTENGNYWFPKDTVDNPRIHPVASKELLKKVIKTLRSTPQGLENDQIEWTEQIDKVLVDGDFLAISGLVRDLSVLKEEKKLDRILSKGLKTLENRLLQEWAAAEEVNMDSIRPKIQTYLRESRASIREGNDDETKK